MLLQLTLLHHHLKELDDDSAGRANQYLPLAPLLCIVHGFKGIAQYADAHHAGQSDVNAPFKMLHPFEGCRA